jgi:hypothetical protein
VDVPSDCSGLLKNENAPTVKAGKDGRTVLNRTRVVVTHLNGSITETRECLADQKVEYGKQ